MIELRNISKDFGSFSLKKISLTADKGSYYILLGNSGSGKSVLLECIAGFIQPDSGDILVQGVNITHLPIRKRKIALVFHDSALFPHLNVRSNLLYSLKGAKTSNNEKESLVTEMADLLEISHIVDRYPAKLSAGEKQRVALARALVMKPEVLMLDEPLAAMDVTLRSSLRNLLRKINRNGQTIIHVTHDFEEAAMLATDIAVIENGTIVQAGKPAHVFQYPKSEFAARFSGFKNFFEGHIENDHNQKYFISGNTKFSFSNEEADGKGFVVIRSEDITLSLAKPETSARNCYLGKVLSIEPLHSNYEIIIDAGLQFSAYITSASLHELSIDIGMMVWISFKAFAVKFIEK